MLYRKILEESLIQSQIHADLMRFESAPNKYKRLCEMNPQVVAACSAHLYRKLSADDSGNAVQNPLEYFIIIYKLIKNGVTSKPKSHHFCISL